MNSRITTLDVRQDFLSGRQPCDKIKSALKNVASGDTLRLLIPFEPVPLFQVAASGGLGHTASRAAEGHWEVLFFQDSGAASRCGAEDVSQAACGCQREKTG
jgi:hypothetical protein